MLEPLVRCTLNKCSTRCVKHPLVCVCVCLGSLLEVLEEMGGPKLKVAERLGKKRLHPGKPFRHGGGTSGVVLIPRLVSDGRRGENAPQNRRLGERLGKTVATEAPPHKGDCEGQPRFRSGLFVRLK